MNPKKDQEITLLALIILASHAIMVLSPQMRVLPMAATLAPTTKSFSQLVYTRSAAARVCGCDPWQVARVEVWPSVVFIRSGQPGGKRSRLAAVLTSG